MKTVPEMFNQLSLFMEKLPALDQRHTITDNELLAKLAFNQVFGFTFEDFLIDYHKLPNVLADFQAQALVRNSLEISVQSPTLKSTIRRDANGDISSVDIRFLSEQLCTWAYHKEHDFKNSPTKNHSMERLKTILIISMYKEDDQPHVKVLCQPDLTEKETPDCNLKDISSSIDLARRFKTAAYLHVRKYAENKRPEIYSCQNKT